VHHLAGALDTRTIPARALAPRDEIGAYRVATDTARRLADPLVQVMGPRRAGILRVATPVACADLPITGNDDDRAAGAIAPSERTFVARDRPSCSAPLGAYHGFFFGGALGIHGDIARIRT
jgi:hypothetical protein